MFYVPFSISVSLVHEFLSPHRIPVVAERKIRPVALVLQQMFHDFLLTVIDRILRFPEDARCRRTSDRAFK